MRKLHHAVFAAATFALASTAFAQAPRIGDAKPAAGRAPVPVAAGLAGHWEGNMTSEDKTFVITFDLHIKGSVVTGTVEIPSLDRVAQITEGTINGNAFAFKGSGRWTGTIEGDRLTLTRGMDYGKKQYMTAHRVGSPASK